MSHCTFIERERDRSSCRLRIRRVILARMPDVVSRWLASRRDQRRYFHRSASTSSREARIKATWNNRIIVEHYTPGI